MGNLGAPLLQALGLNTPGTAPSPVGVVPPENGMTEAVMGFPSILRGGITETGALPNAGGQADEMAAVVQGFKPKKISFWGALGDQLLKHWGNQPLFQQRIQDKNLNKAMQGFTSDPVEAIARIAQIPGMQGKAWDLLNQQVDNQRANDQLARMQGKDRESIINRANQLFGAVKADGSNWPTIKRLYEDIMRRNNINDVFLPEEWDPETIGAQIAGGMTMSQQDLSRYRDARLKQLDAAEAGRNARAAEAEAGKNARFQQGEAGKNTRFQQGEAGKDRRSNKGNGTSGERKLKDGSTVRYSPDKTTAIVTRPDGRQHWLERQLDGSYKTVKVQ